MNSPMRIGLVGPLPPPFGGMGNQTRQLADLLTGEGLSVSIVRTNDDYRPRWVAHIPIVRAGIRLLPYMRSLWRQAGSCDVMHVMANSGWSWHLFAAPAIWIAHWRNTPVIVNYRGGEAENFLRKSASLVRLSMQKSAAMIVPSGFLQAVFNRFNLAAQIVPNVIDLDHFGNPLRPNRIRRHVIVARNLELIYDNESAIRAFSLVFRKHPDARLTIAGSGPQSDFLKALVKSLGLQSVVTFAGRLDRNAMALAYQTADIALNPSLVDNMPNSILEALASGLPVVSTNVGGIPFIVTNQQTALLVPPKEPQAMANAILTLMENPALANSLANAGLAEAKKYTWHTIWPQLSKVYRQASQRPNRTL